MSHSHEPWRDDRGDILDSNGDCVEYYSGGHFEKRIGPANRKRIIACVNALAGIPDEDLTLIAKYAAWWAAGPPTDTNFKDLTDDELVEIAAGRKPRLKPTDLSR